MSSYANMEKLFHLVPKNQVAHDALLHLENRRFVSTCRDGRFGLEVGFHVPSVPQGHVITRLGRNADLILQESTFQQPMSAIHVAFEIDPITHLVVLSVRSKRTSNVAFGIEVAKNPQKLAREIFKQEVGDERAESEIAEEVITGDGVILYGRNCHIAIASYRFILLWRAVPDSEDKVEFLKALTVQGYQLSLQRLRYLRSRDRPTEYDGSDALSWHVTRLNTVKGSHFQDDKRRRRMIGSGSFGEVYRAVDQVSGRTFAIKIVKLDRHDDVEAARAIFHREVKVMERLRHVSDFLTTHSLG